MIREGETEFGLRNVWCPHYGPCLDRCLENKKPGFECKGCQSEHDQSAGPKDQAELEEEAINCRALLFVVLGRVRRESAFRVQGVLAKRGGVARK